MLGLVAAASLVDGVRFHQVGSLLRHVGELLIMAMQYLQLVFAQVFDVDEAITGAVHGCHHFVQLPSVLFPVTDSPSVQGQHDQVFRAHTF